MVLGQNPRRFTPSNREKLGYMPQLFALFPDLSVWENMNFAASLYGKSPFGRKKRILQTLEFVELRQHAGKLARNLSGGMQHRLSLAATLVHDPELVFLDEPMAGIDPVLRQKLWLKFKDLQKQGRTLFVTTQYVGEAVNCDFIGVLVEGNLIAVDTPQGLRYHTLGGEIVELRTEQPVNYEQMLRIQNLDFIRGKVNYLGENTLRMTVDNASSSFPKLIELCVENGIKVVSIQEYVPPFDEVYVYLVQQSNEQENDRHA